jgi:hypothetical protein
LSIPVPGPQRLIARDPFSIILERIVLAVAFAAIKCDQRRQRKGQARRECPRFFCPASNCGRMRVRYFVMPFSAIDSN